jgi:hypothetical protein
MRVGTLQDVRAANVKALGDSTMLALSRDDFNKLLGNLQDIRNIWRLEALRKVHCFPFTKFTIINKLYSRDDA